MTNGTAGRRRRWLVGIGVLVVICLVPAVVSTAAAPDGTAAAAGSLGAGGALLPVLQPRATDIPPGYLRVELPEPVRTDLARLAVEAAEGAAASSTELAAAVLDRETGELVGGTRGAEPYYTASLSKVVVAVDMLDRRRLDGLTLTDDDLALLRRALGPSDDAAMNVLWTRFDGAGAPARLTRRLGLTGASAPDDPSQWGEMRVPAVDTVRIWGHILDAMPTADRRFLIGALDAAPAVARDGFDQTFGLLAPGVDGPDAPGAVAKQGWMCCFSGEYYLHSAGAVGDGQRFVVALLTRIPRGPGWGPARTEVTAIAEALVSALVDAGGLGSGPGASGRG